MIEAVPPHVPRTEFAPAKVNLWLEIIGKRKDGYHEILTVMDAIDFGDLVHLEPADELEVQADREDVPNGEANIAYRIVRAAERRLGQSLPAKISLQKRVPPGTGLGAGSSDAAAALRGVLALHGLEVPVDEQRAIAAEVGSDVGFFVTGGLGLCFGRGEHVVPLQSAGPRHYVLVLGSPPAATALVYRALELGGAPRSPLAPVVKDLVTTGFPSFAHRFNRLEEPAAVVVPDLARIRKQLAAAAGEKPMLSGSGSAFYFCLQSAEQALEVKAKLDRLRGLDVRLAKSTCEGVGALL